ncbi:hypothetical protein [Corynebacterium sp.]|uniref:hypothetical protein n=1 Tax=Corynebacterium sp. TaxID=1720 RepID=UPI003B3A71B9
MERRPRRRKTGVVGKAHVPDRDLDVTQVVPDTAEPSRTTGTTGDTGGFGDDFWQGQRPPHW